MYKLNRIENECNAVKGKRGESNGCEKEKKSRTSIASCVVPPTMPDILCYYYLIGCSIKNAVEFMARIFHILKIYLPRNGKRKKAQIL